MQSTIRSLFKIEHVLLLALLALAGTAAESLSTDTRHAPLWLLAIGGGTLGILLGTLRTPDSLSHLMAIGSGAAGTIAITAYRQLPGEESLSFWGRFGRVATDLKDWYVGTTPQENLDDLLVMILLQMIIWLISYLSAWSLVRQRWLTVALVLPAVIVLVSMLVGTETRENLLEIYLVIAIVLMARVTYVRRQQSREAAADRRASDVAGWLALIPAAMVALIVVGAGAATPPGFSNDTIRPVADVAGQRYLEAQDQALDWIAGQLELSGSGPVSFDSFPRYTAFDDAFSVGGDLNLSDQPEVLVRTASEAPYLTAQSYDSYTGRGWESTAEDTFQAEGPDGVRYSPELTFRPGQEVPYSSSVSNARIPITMEVTPLTPSGDVMFNGGMFSTADERASVRMSWVQFDEAVFPLREMDLSSIPPDLTGIVSQLLQASEFSVEGDNGLLYPADATQRDSLELTRSQLQDRFIDVSWSIADDGMIDTMIVTGQVPVYEDNVRVSRASGSSEGTGYGVTSLVSEATSDQLKGAPADYPAWVQSRYLELPESVTPRTIDLAFQQTASATNPYDRAKAIETFLRQHIAYDLDVGVPPADADIVDYVLFELQRGYCEYYASAMTVMLRALGIPAKTVVGYFPGEFDAERDGYVYRQENAHAWTEVYFPGYGWIPFEPTASQPPSSFGDVRIDSQPTPTPTPTPPTEAPDVPGTATPLPIQDQAESDIPQPVSEDPGEDGGVPWGPIATATVLGLAAIGAGAWFLATRCSGLEARSLFASLVRWGRAGGVRADPSSTPREYARQLGRRYPDLGPDAFEVVGAYEEYRYGNATPSPPRLEQAAASLRHLRRRLIRSVIRRK